MYVADGSSAGVKKFSFDGSTWTARGATATGSAIIGIYADDNGSSVDLYFTSNQGLYTVTDASAAAANITNNGGLLSALTPIYTSPTGTRLNGVSAAPLNVITPDVAHTFTTPVTTLTTGAGNQAIYRIQIDVTTASATLAAITLVTNGTYTSTDISAFKLVRSTDGILDGGDTEFSNISPTSGTGETLSFTSAENFAIGTHYIFVVANVDGCATVGHTVGINNFSLPAIEYYTANATGTPIAGTTYTINAGTPSNVTALSITSGGSVFDVEWNNPTCFDQILVVADVNPIVAVPNGATTYTANSNYNTGGGTLFGTTGRVVYQGTLDNFLLTGLNVGQQYYVKVFTKYSGVYSAGVQTSATATNTTFYSQGSGTISDPIWGLTPTDMPATAASLGGFSSTSNIVVQNGHTITVNSSPLNVRNMTVNFGGTLTSTATYPTSLQYVQLYGILTNNGTFGGPTVALGIAGESATPSITATNPIYAARLSKRTNVPATSTLTINSGIVYLGFNGLAITPNLASRFNVTINSGASVICNGGNFSSVGIDVNLGAPDAAEKAGTITVNGKLDAGTILYQFNNNATAGNTTPFVIGATGTVIVDSAIVSQTSTAPALLTITAGGKLQIRRHMQLSTGNLAAGMELLSTNGYTARLAALSAGQTVGSIRYERATPAGPGSAWHFMAAPVVSQTFDNWINLGVRLTPKNNANTFFYTENDTTRGSYNGHLTERAGWKVLNATTDQINPSNQPVGYRIFTLPNRKTSITGVPFQGNVTKNLTFSPTTGWDGGGWNLTANPYPAELDWNAFKTFNSSANLTGTVYVYNGNTQSYATYSQALGATNGGSRYIQSGQGFFAKTTGAVTVTFKENQKGAGGTGYLRQGVDANVLHMFLENGTNSDEALVAFRDDATAGFDGEFDANKLAGTFLNVSTMPVAGLNLAANAMPGLTATQIIPVRTDVASAGNYTLRFTGIETFDAGTVVYLRDNFLNTLTDLSQAQSYAFSVTSNPGTIANRFTLVAGPASVTATAAKIAQTALRAYPNPSKGSFTVSASGLKGTSASISLIGADGRVAYVTSAALTGNGTVEVSVKASLAAGVYTLRLVATGQVITEKLVVE